MSAVLVTNKAFNDNQGVKDLFSISGSAIPFYQSFKLHQPQCFSDIQKLDHKILNCALGLLDRR